MNGPTGTLAARLRQVRRTQREHAVASAGTARELVIVAFAVPVVALALLALVVAVTMALAGSGFGAFGAVLGSAWLCLHQVPLSVGGVEISALPLLPTIAVFVAVVRYAGPSARLRTTPADLGALVAAAAGGPLLITALALALVFDGSSVVPVNPPNALWAFASTVLIYGGGTLAGIGRRDWREWCERAGITGDRLTDLVAGVRTGVLAALMLVGAGAVAVCLLLIVNWQSVSAVIAGGNGFDGYLGLVVVSLLYLPNLAVDGAAGGVVAGGGGRVAAHRGAVAHATDRGGVGGRVGVGDAAGVGVGGRVADRAVRGHRGAAAAGRVGGRLAGALAGAGGDAAAVAAGGEEDHEGGGGDALDQCKSFHRRIRLSSQTLGETTTGYHACERGERGGQFSDRGMNLC